MTANKKTRSLWGSRSEAQKIYYQRQEIKRLEKENEKLNHYKLLYQKVKERNDKAIEYIEHFSKDSEIRIYGIPETKVFIGDIGQLFEILKGD